MDLYETRLLDPLLLLEDSESQAPVLFPDQVGAEGSRDSSDSAVQQQGQFRRDHDEEIAELMYLFGIPFIRSCEFWRKFVASILIGFLIGCVTAAFFALILLYKIGPVNSTIPNELNYLALRLSSAVGKLGHWEGTWSWLNTTILGSVLAGFILALRPELRNPRNLFMEIRDLDPELMAAPFKLLSCLISLLSGASIGPEAVLATIGSVLGSLSAKALRVSFAGEKSMILSGIAGALGVIFPLPFLGVLCVVEISIVTSREQIFYFEKSSAHNNDFSPSRQESDAIDVTQKAGYHNFMQQITLMGVTASVAFVTLSTFREPRSSLVAEVDGFHVAEDDKKFQLFSQIAHSALLGTLCGLAGASYLILQGLFRTIAQRISKRLLRRFGVQRYWLVTLMFPFFAGVIYGVVAVAYPLTLGSGHEYIGWLLTLWEKNESAKFIQNGPDEVLTKDLLLVSALLKLLTTATCLGFGLFGGQIVPLVVAGVYLGFAVAFYVPFLSVPLSVACCSIGIAGSFVPIPFTLVATISSLGLTSVSAVPVFISVLCAFATNAGLGVVVEIAKRKPRASGCNDVSEQHA